MLIRLLQISFLWILTSLPVAAQTTDSDRWPLKSEAPSMSLIFGRSPMLLIEGHWLSLEFLRGFGAESVGKNLEDRVRKVGTTLVLKIDEDRELRLFDLPDRMSEAGPTTHRFEAWLPGPQLYVVSVSCNECYLTYLIDARDGRVFLVPVPPILSPSGHFGVSWDSDTIFGSGIPTLVDFRAVPPVGLSVPTNSKCGPIRPTTVWLDDSSVRFEGPFQGREDLERASSGKQILRIVDGRAEWEC